MAEEFEQVVAVLRKFGVDTVAAIQKSIDTKKISASGNMRQSLNYRVTVTELYTKFTLDFGKADYAYQMDKGRGPTHGGGTGKVYQSLTGLQGWISHKGIAPPMTVFQKRFTKKGVQIVRKTFIDIADANKNLARLIARKIHRKGFKGTNFYSSVVTSQLFDKLKQDLRAAAKKDILIQIRQAF